MTRFALVALLSLAAGCVGAERDTFATGDRAGAASDVPCNQEDFSYLVQDVLGADQVEHFTCAAPAATPDGPAFDGWFAPTTVVPGGLLLVELFSSDPPGLEGRTLILDAPEVLGHTRFTLTQEHISQEGARFRVLLRHDLAAGPQTLGIAMLDDYGPVEATGPVIEVPVTVVPLDVDAGPRGLRISLTWWSVDEHEILPDLDLSVVEPDGTEVSAAEPVALSGGTMEHVGDATCHAGGDVESTSWPQGAPGGRYTAFASVRDTCGYQGLLHWTAAFTYFDRLIAVFDGDIDTTDGATSEGQTVDLSWVDME